MMTENAFYSEKKKWIPALILIYTSAHWFLFIATGRWWQSWLHWNTSNAAFWEFSKQMGRPSVYFIIRFVEAFPGPVYRILTFLMYLASMFFLYGILRNWIHLSPKATFWISAIYAVIPADDMRIMRGAFPYSLGVFLFMAGMYLMSVLLEKGKVERRYRALEWVLFLGAFCALNSTLFFYGIVLLMILFKERSLKKLFVGYADFIMLPVFFYIAKNVFFPVYGYFCDYNMVTVGGIIPALGNTIIADGLMIRRLITNLIEINAKWIAIPILLSVATFVVLNRKIIGEVLLSCIKNQDLNRGLDPDSNSPIKDSIIVLMLGIIILSAALFPYIVVRGSYDIRTRGLDGRDASLVAFGAAMIIYSVVILVFRLRLSLYMFIFIILCGAGYFNVYYLNYQRDHYYQLGFQYHLRQNYDLLYDAYRVVVHPNFDYGDVHQNERALLNGNAVMVFGDKTRYYAYSVEDAMSDEHIQFQKVYPWWNVEDFDLNNRGLDAILEYSAYISYVDTVKMKWYEFTNIEKLNEYLNKDTKMEVYLSGTAEFDEAIVEDIRRQEELERQG